MDEQYLNKVITKLEQGSDEGLSSLLEKISELSSDELTQASHYLSEHLSDYTIINQEINNQISTIEFYNGKRSKRLLFSIGFGLLGLGLIDKFNDSGPKGLLYFMSAAFIGYAALLSLSDRKDYRAKNNLKTLKETLLKRELSF